MVYESWQSWFTNHGLRAIVYEPWFTSHGSLGLRIMVYEPWFTSHGIRSIVYEPWFTEAEVNLMILMLSHVTTPNYTRLHLPSAHKSLYGTVP